MGAGLCVCGGRGGCLGGRVCVCVGGGDDYRGCYDPGEKFDVKFDVTVFDVTVFDVPVFDGNSSSQNFTLKFQVMARVVLFLFPSIKDVKQFFQIFLNSLPQLSRFLV